MGVPRRLLIERLIGASWNGNAQINELSSRAVAINPSSLCRRSYCSNSTAVKKEPEIASSSEISSSSSEEEQQPTVGVGSKNKSAKVGARFSQGRAVYRIPDYYDILGKRYKTDDWSNIPGPLIEKWIGKSLLQQERNPLFLLKKRIMHYFDNNYRATGNRSPLFSLHEFHDPVVTVDQNFGSLLIGETHVARSKSDTYYVNTGHVLRSHTSAYQMELIQSGLDAFMVMGDVYRRDSIDKTHTTAFHQMEGVRLFNDFQIAEEYKAKDLKIFQTPPDSSRHAEKQEKHTMDVVKLLEHHLKKTLVDFAQSLYGKEIETRWVDAYFPFTHPSWELEVNLGTKQEPKWMETLGCGIIEQKILENAGVNEKVGWAFGIGMERVAMTMYQIPDIRLFRSKDTAFTSQFKTKDFMNDVKYQAISQFPQVLRDFSFWMEKGNEFEQNDFTDYVHELTDLVEQVELIDDFTHPKTGRRSHCYRLSFRHHFRALGKEEVEEIKEVIFKGIEERFNAEARSRQPPK